MTPAELLAEGRLADALAAAATPADPAGHVFLCELLAFAGDPAVRDRVAALPGVDPRLADYTAGWLDLLDADDARRRVLAGRGRPAFLLDPPPDVIRRLRCLKRLAEGRGDDALDALDAAERRTDYPAGHVDGREFETWRDADDILASVVEVVADGRYAWLSVSQISRLRLAPTAVPRDRLYRPARVRLADGSEHDVYLFGVYAEETADEVLRVGAGTDFVERRG